MYELIYVVQAAHRRRKIVVERDNWRSSVTVAFKFILDRSVDFGTAFVGKLGVFQFFKIDCRELGP